jgi:hypothetical protein
MHHVRQMVALGVESRRKFEHMRGAKLDAEAARLAALDHN